MNLINQHKNFILSISGGAFVFLLCLYFIGSIFSQAREVKMDIQSGQSLIESRMEKLKDPSRHQGLQHHRSLAPLLEKSLLPQVEKDLLFSPSPDFQWKKGGKNPAFYFSTKKSQISRSLSLLADRYSFTFPDLGFSKTNVGEKDVQEYLTRLELVQQVLQHAILSGLQKITTLDAETPSSKTPIPGTNRAIKKISLKLGFLGENKALLKFLSGFAKKGNPLLPHLELQNLVITPSTNEKWLNVHITLSAIFLVTLKKKAPEGSRKKGGRSPRGWIRKMR